MTPKINFRFVIFTACMFLTPFFILAHHLNKRSAELARRDMQDALSVRVRITARQARQSLQAQYGIAALLDSKPFLSASVKGRKELLEKLAESKPGLYLQFSYLDADGMEKFRVRGSSSPLENHAGSELFRIAVRGGSPGVVRAMESAPPRLTMAEPVFDGNKIAAVLVSAVSLEPAAAAIMAERLPGDPGETGLTDGGGMIIADSRNGGRSAPVFLPKEVFAMKNVPEGAPAGGSITMPDGTRYLIAFAQVPGTQWWTYEMEPESYLKDFWPSSCGSTPVFGGALFIILLAFLVERMARTWLATNETGERS